jgi:hypothetical protein
VVEGLEQLGRGERLDIAEQRPTAGLLAPLLCETVERSGHRSKAGRKVLDRMEAPGFRLWRGISGDSSTPPAAAVLSSVGRGIINPSFNRVPSQPQ